MFANRREAGQLLGERLASARQASKQGASHDLVVLALPRGGLPVGAEVAMALQCPLDIFLVRKIGVPGHEELAMGAIASGGTLVVNEDVTAMIGIEREAFFQAAAREEAELERRQKLYRSGRPPISIFGKTAIVVDDGIATGATMQAAARALRQLKPAQVVIAAPVAAPSVQRRLAPFADQIVILQSPEDFGAVGAWYKDFPQLTDDQVQKIMRNAAGFTQNPRGNQPPALK